jgi:hypothetical protein
MKNKIIAAAAINALKEALTSVYWYKSNLRSFIQHCISDPTILSKVNWEDYKRNIVSDLIDHLASDQATYMGDLLRLMSEVIKINDFTHLERLEDGREKARNAREAISALAKLYKTHEVIEAEQERIEESRKAAYEERLRNKAVTDKLEELKSEFYQLISSSDHQARGYSLERIIKELFLLFDLDPKSSFRITGEQLDGAFTFDGTDYLFECKWHKILTDIQDLDAFSGKLSRKLDNTLGLFLSINGFSEDAVKAHSTGRRAMILMDGSDLMAVLEGRVDLIQLLLRKRRHASQTGNIYLKIHELL